MDDKMVKMILKVIDTYKNEDDKDSETIIENRRVHDLRHTFAT